MQNGMTRKHEKETNVGALKYLTDADTSALLKPLLTLLCPLERQEGRATRG